MTDRPALEHGVVDVWICRLERAPRSGPVEPEPQPEVGSILARYTGYDPAGIRLVPGRNGKPELRNEIGLRFNLSRTPGTMLLAVSLGIEVGVDVELVRDGPWRTLPAHALSDREQADLASCDAQSRGRMFLTYWARKEAILKAAGVGLSIEPQRVEVTAPWEPAGITAVPDEIGPTSRWSLVDLHVPDCVAALAAEDPDVLVRLVA